MASLFGGLFTGSQGQAQPAAPSGASKGTFTGLFPSQPSQPTPKQAPIAPVEPVRTFSPSTNTNAASSDSGIPESALRGSLGGGYGTAVDVDPASGKHLLTYENPKANASQLLSDRTAPSFDPSVAQKVDPKTLQDERMKVSVSQGIKKSIGGTAFTELDHIMPLELGGSNNKNNLRLEPGKNPNQPYSGSNPTQTDSLENQLADAVHSGNMSLVDAWKQMAKAKGITLPEDSGVLAKTDQTRSSTNEDTSFLGKAAAFIRNAFSPEGQMNVFNALGGNAIVHPIQTLNAIVKNADNDITTTLTNLGSSAKNVIAPNQNAAQRTASILDFLTSAVSTVMTPVSETFNIASQLPVIKPAADAVGIVFDKTGKIGGFSAEKLLEQLPLSNETKATLSQSVKNVGTLAGQIVLGGYVFGKATGLMDAKGKIAPEAEKALIEDAQQKAQEVNTSPIKKTITPENPEKTQTKTQELTAQETAPAKTEETPVQEPAPRQPQTTEPAPRKNLPAGALRPIEGTGLVKTRGLAEGVEAKAVSAKLTDAFGDLPEYRQMNVADQGARAIDLFQKNPDAARQIALGEKTPPKGLTPEAVFIAVENAAIERGDAELLTKLANSRLTSEATTMGQRLRLLAERNPESPTEAIKMVRQAREQAIQQKYGGKTIDVIRDREAGNITREITRASSRPRDWSSFISSIEC